MSDNNTSFFLISFIFFLQALKDWHLSLVISAIFGVIVILEIINFNISNLRSEVRSIVDGGRSRSNVSDGNGYHNTHASMHTYTHFFFFFYAASHS